MGSQEAGVMILNAFLIHFFLTFDIQSYIFNVDTKSITLTTKNVSTGIARLLFPLFGLVANIWVKRYMYRMIQTSLIIDTKFMFLFHKARTTKEVRKSIFLNTSNA